MLDLYRLDFQHAETGLSDHAAQCLRRRGYPCHYPGDRRRSCARRRDDPVVRGRHDECPQALRHRCRPDGPHGQGRHCPHRKQRVSLAGDEGGIVEYLVKLNDKVEPGQKVATQRNSFGEVIAEYTSAIGGKVMGLRTDAMAEPGNPLVMILFNKATPATPGGTEIYPE